MRITTISVNTEMVEYTYIKMLLLNMNFFISKMLVKRV